MNSDIIIDALMYQMLLNMLSAFLAGEFYNSKVMGICWEKSM
jgi:hypothetical protein